MKPSLVDTDTLSFFFKRHPSVVSSFEAYSQQYDRVNLSIITYYEILSGLKHRDANKKLEIFLDFAAQNTVLSLTEETATIVSENTMPRCVNKDNHLRTSTSSLQELHCRITLSW